MKNKFSMEGKVVVITGGHGYFGSAMAKGLLDFGAKVVLADVSTKDYGELGLKDYKHVYSIYCDVSSTNSIREMFRQTKETVGTPNVLINNAYYGAGYGNNGLIDRMSDEVWLKGLDGAAGTAFRCTREVIPYLKEQGGGNIVNIASMYGIVSPDPRIYGDSEANNPVNYGAGKAAVLQLTRYCAGHLAPYNIRVNSITPGPFPHPQMAKEQPAFMAKLGEKTMLGRIGKQDELTGAALLLASDASSYMTGANIVIDGGWTAW